MRLLSTALYAEGHTDVEFLRPVLQRLCLACAAKADDVVEVSDVLALDDLPADRSLPRDRRILSAARAADGAWIVLFIHADADGDDHLARANRVEPARRLLTEEFGVRRQSVAVVPVRTSDAWVLADPDALRQAFGTKLSDAALGLSEAMAHGVDHLGDPKGRLQAALRAAKPQRHAGSVTRYLGRVGELASFERLRRLVAFAQLETDLVAALRAIGILRSQ